MIRVYFVVLQDWDHELLREFMIPLNATQPSHNGQSSAVMTAAATAAEHFNTTNSSWNSNKEIARLLFSAPSHPEWITQQVAIRPQTGTQYMVCRFDGNWFKMDGYEWKKRREGKLVREDHMKLKVNKQEILSANYAHSSVVPTFHRRVYWLTDNPRFALVHYLNTETEPSLKNIVDKILACLKLNSLNLGQQQLFDQISPIYANILSQQDIMCICENLSNVMRFANTGNTSPALNNMLDSAPLKEALTGYSTDCRSHSGETQRSSNQDEDMAGGLKVLVIGGWYMKGHEYSVVFGERRVPARLIQVGVLAVIAPSASICGPVNVRVLCNGQVVSASAEFVYEDEQDDVNTTALRQCMIDRLQILVHAFGAMDRLKFDPLARDGEGRTPLHVAVAAGHVASARVLVRACRTTVDVLDDRGRTPCDLSSDEQMMRLTARTGDRDVDEPRALPKNDQNIRRDQIDSSSSILSDVPNDDHQLGRPGPSRARWCDEPLHVEISMDTDVHVPDSPKMADLFEAVTSPGIMLNDGVRAKMALLAQQIIDALPDRIKNDAHQLIDDESMSGDVSAQSSFAYPDNNPFLSNLTHDCSVDWEFQQYFANNHYQYLNEKPTEDVLSSFPRQSSSPSFDHNHLYPNKGANSSYGSSRDNTLESTSFDFDKDLGEFFNMRVDGEEDPIRQRLGDLKLSENVEECCGVKRAVRVMTVEWHGL
ncbi:unnamed protein product [Nippostrongylus brasiliensis]|uniref:CG-1 domain-containing protein n=1 Tax=Nippostrongylus brasiliensis TaxID=27835 RepID=A0A0N4XY54_NIPBR|nr:unnamed protein product [Nippostrongylus brasiliensis]